MADGLRYLRGEELLTSYKVPQAQRFTSVFCRVCGSSLPVLNRASGAWVIPMGTLDDDPGYRPQAHIFVGSKAQWYDLGNSLPEFDEHRTEQQ